MNEQIREVLSRKLTLENAELENRTVILRVDLNSPVKNKKPLMSKRIIEHSKTIKKLSDLGAKVVVLSHQGRPGREDFISLKEHAKLIEKILGKEVRFCTWDGPFLKKIEELGPGEIILMENTRFLPFESSEENPEKHAAQPLIKELAKRANLFVLDALSVAHRKHASVVGFIPLLMSFIGPVLEKELRAISNALEQEEKPIFCLGGAKPEDTLKVAKKVMNKHLAKAILFCGIPGELCIIGSKMKIGPKEKWLKEKGMLELASEYRKLIEVSAYAPVDLAFEENYERVERTLAMFPGKGFSYDIGSYTAEYYASIIRKNPVIMNGTAGMYEKEDFAYGTRKLFEAASKSKHALLGGGDTASAAFSLGFKNEEFSYVSLSGKAFLKAVACEPLAALDAILTFSSNRK